MSAVVLLGTKHPLFQTLGIPYALLLREEHDPFTIYDAEQGRQALHELVQGNEITGAELFRLEAQIIELGILERIENVLEQVRRFPIQKDVPSYLSAVPCSRCTPTKHFHIMMNGGGENLGDSVVSFEQLFDLVWAGIQHRKLHLYDGICLLQQVMGEVGRGFLLTTRDRLVARRVETQGVAVG